MTNRKPPAAGWPEPAAFTKRVLVEATAWNAIWRQLPRPIRAAASVILSVTVAHSVGLDVSNVLIALTAR
ncbi:hypothetical protein AB4Z14_21995 [Terrabacter sp. 2TAF16]|uniref:hypothetical protein n=1 Tax=Terrabacter sp. 2TAF16 TaxID=3233008 RepID=UPI003F9B126D